jgi:hypothetical protein
VRTQAFINGQSVAIGQDNHYVAVFRQPAGKHTEHAISEDDGEVQKLSAALVLFESDFRDFNPETRNTVRHELALVGPYGACDGCKDRIRLFKNIWRELSREFKQRYGLYAELIVSYVYRENFSLNRTHKTSGQKEKTLYGWDEGVAAMNHGNQSNLNVRSYVASNQGTPSNKPNLFAKDIQDWKKLR